MTYFLQEYRNILVFIIASFVLAVVLLLAVYVLSFTSKVDLEKSSAYECGFQPFSETSYPFEVEFAMIAVMFLLFDIEVLYLFPLISSLFTLASVDLFVITSFYVIILLGLGFEISRKVLDFNKSSVKATGQSILLSNGILGFSNTLSQDYTVIKKEISHLPLEDYTSVLYNPLEELHNITFSFTITLSLLFLASIFVLYNHDTDQHNFFVVFYYKIYRNIYTISFFGGIIFVVYVLYICLFLGYVPKSLNIDHLDALYKLKISIVILFIIQCFFQIIRNFLITVNIKPNINILVLMFQSTFWNHRTIVTRWLDKYYCDPISKGSYKAYTYTTVFPAYYILIILFSIRFIIVFIFLYEVFFTLNLNYFYKGLALFGIVLVINVVIVILRYIAHQRDIKKNQLIIEDWGIDEHTNLPIRYYKETLKSKYWWLDVLDDYDYAAEKADENEDDNNEFIRADPDRYRDLEFIRGEYLIAKYMSEYLLIYDNFQKKYKPIINVVINLLYLTGWLYVLYNNINVF